jgi:hypothetical protein
VAGKEVVSVGWTTNPRAAMAGYRAAHPIAWGVRHLAPLVFVVTGFARGDLAGVILGCAIYVVLGMSIRRQLGPAGRGQFDHLLVATDDELQLNGAARPWSAFASARRRGGQWVLRLNRAIAVAVPVEAFDEGESTAFVDLLRRKGLLR